MERAVRELDPAFQAFFQRQAATVRPAPGSLPLSAVRAGYRAQRQGLNANPPAGISVRDLVISRDAGQLVVRLYDPGVRVLSGLLVYFHGGGFVIGDLESHDAHCRRLASAAGCKVLAVDYRLAPEHPFPAAHDDAVWATRWAFDHAAELEIDPGRIAVGGDSAGGNLAASVAVGLIGDPSRRLAFQLLLYPGLWPEEETTSRRELDGPVLTRAGLAWFDQCLKAQGHPQVHRLNLERADVIGAPPGLIVTAGFDPLKDEGRDYAVRLREAGVAVQHIEYQSLPHDFFVMADISPAVFSAVAEIAGILQSALADGACRRFNDATVEK